MGVRALPLFSLNDKWLVRTVRPADIIHKRRCAPLAKRPERTNQAPKKQIRHHLGAQSKAAKPLPDQQLAITQLTARSSF
ncbi:hypothetical protein [Ectopseudomonas mendocina]|uniref:hypothetical protein n=1 Tax=Ectopseudomonas mendocina TaxID=300 RepID=UPI00376EA101